MSAIKSVTQTVQKTLSPKRAFFNVSENIPTIQHARAVFKTLGAYGDMLEYKVMRCPETLKYLRHGFVVYKNEDDAKKAIADQFIRIQSELFDKPVEIKVESSLARTTFKNNRKNENYNKKN
ncbi:hypothetical protein BD770DRAFT_335549 [Pilaira anomala]|nr:hypothetical protein BD770DRAFT_335549 [Pilaira anomala]